MSSIFVVYSLVYDVAEIFLHMFFASIFCVQRAQTKPVHIRAGVFVLWYGLAHFLAQVYDADSLIRFTLVIIVNTVFVYLLFETTMVKSAIIALSYFAIALGSEGLIFLVCRIFMQRESVATMFRSDIGITLGTISMMLKFTIMVIIRQIMSKGPAKRILARDWLKYILFPLFTAAIMIVIVTGSGNLSEVQTGAFAAIAALMILMNIYVYFFIRREVVGRLEKEESRLAAIHADELLAMYNQSCAERDILAHSEHEYKNKISVLCKLMEAGEYDQAREMLEKENHSMLRTANVIDCGNSVISAVFNTKYAEAKIDGIRVTFDFDNLSEVKLDDAELITVFSNLMNNAIEACEKVEEGRFMNVAVKIVNEDSLMFSIKNSCAEEPKTDYDKNLVTAKNDNKGHGYGVANIKAVAEKRGGAYRWRYTDGVFTSVAVIPFK